METKTGQHDRRMATMRRVLSRLRHELEAKKAHPAMERDGDRPPHRKPSKPRRPGRRLDA